MNNVKSPSRLRRVLVWPFRVAGRLIATGVSAVAGLLLLAGFAWVGVLAYAACNDDFRTGTASVDFATVHRQSVSQDLTTPPAPRTLDPLSSDERDWLMHRDGIVALEYLRARRGSERPLDDATISPNDATRRQFATYAP